MINLTPTQISLHEAHKARRQRQWLSAARVKRVEALPAPSAPQPANDRPRPRLVGPETAQHDDHVTTWRRYLMETGFSPRKRFIRERCIDFGVSYDEVVGPSRYKRLVWPRQVIMFELKERFDLSLPEIGRMFGGRDHSTCLHAIRKVAEKMRAA